jgi:hypothetical protein
MRGLLVSLLIAAVAVGGFMIVERGGSNIVASVATPHDGSQATYCGGVGRGGESCR